MLTNNVVSMTVTDQKSLEAVSEMKVKYLKPLLKAAEEERTMFSTTLRRMATAWDAKFKPGIDKVKGLISYIDQSIIDYTRAEEKKAKILQDKLNAEAEAKQDSLDKAGLTGQIPDVISELAPVIDTSVRTASGLSSVTTRRDIKIVDEAKIPRQYLIPDTVKIRRDLLKPGSRIIEIPGVEIISIDRVTTR